MRSSRRAAASARSRSRSRSISARSDWSWRRSTASWSAASRRSGTTAPSRIALRTEDRASSGRTRMAGGGRWPIRWRAASTSIKTSRRSSSEARSACFILAQRAEAALGPGDLGFQFLDPLVGLDQRPAERFAVLVERVDLGAKLGEALLGEGDVALDRIELGLPRGALGRALALLAMGRRRSRQGAPRPGASSSSACVKRPRVCQTLPKARRSAKTRPRGINGLSTKPPAATIFRGDCGGTAVSGSLSRGDRGGRRGS